ncbi:MAG: hypothetical protein ACTH7R_09690, partial [Corynebacterium flavescens]|uniref:hypothetical protein n=1 Tax=Corynebacterium flavescens TaxID=28028 RepID=UPI003F913820
RACARMVYGFTDTHSGRHKKLFWHTLNKNQDEITIRFLYCIDAEMKPEIVRQHTGTAQLFL